MAARVCCFRIGSAQSIRGKGVVQDTCLLQNNTMARKQKAGGGKAQGREEGREEDEGKREKKEDIGLTSLPLTQVPPLKGSSGSQ